MSQNTILLLLGSNLGDRKSNLKAAKDLIESEISPILEFSIQIETIAEDYTSNYLFLNQTLKLQTHYSPYKVLTLIKGIETKMGRTYPIDNQRYHDRIIDIDLLCFNKLQFRSSKLTLPHPQIISRNFVKKILI